MISHVEASGDDWLNMMSRVGSRSGGVGLGSEELIFSVEEIVISKEGIIVIDIISIEFVIDFISEEFIIIVEKSGLNLMFSRLCGIGMSGGISLVVDNMMGTIDGSVGSDVVCGVSVMGMSMGCLGMGFLVRSLPLSNGHFSFLLSHMGSMAWVISEPLFNGPFSFLVSHLLGSMMTAMLNGGMMRNVVNWVKGLDWGGSVGGISNGSLVGKSDSKIVILVFRGSSSETGNGKNSDGFLHF
jgi:hypothetical protein